LLEVGFGNGSILRRIKKEFPSLVLAGLEVSDGHRNTLERLGINFIHGEIGSLKKTFDIVIVNNVLEHARDPLDFLLACGRCLGWGGCLIIALPNVKCATYDVIIADHVIHTNAQHVAFLTQKAQFATLFLDDQTIPDQTLVALELTMDPHAPELPLQPRTNENQVIKTIEQKLQTLNEEFVVFGSTIAACWAARYLQDKILFFIDEDETRVGLKINGKEVSAPEDVLPDQKILFLGDPDSLVPIRERHNVSACFVHIADL
jgi:SAM-dependent methyltransferase